MRKISFFLSIFVLAVLLIACTSSSENKGNIDGKNDKDTGFEGITQQQCLESGGKWNECGSPCAGTNADVCIQVCRAQCECNNKEFTCPKGFKCRLSGKSANEIGVCIKG
ncbi:hypothetical protein HYX01_03385 [Candidatus Woesearchaeota archaeon]|nr:hypothetical protein [Candidatus Woesearchaeota archaeon]